MRTRTGCWPASIKSAQQRRLSMRLPSAAPAAASGFVNLAFIPDTTLVTDDPAVVFLATDTVELEKLGRHFIVGYRDPAEIDRLIERRALGGVFVSARNVEGLSAGAIRRQIATETGVVVPPVHVADNLQLPPRAYAILVKGVEVARVEGGVRLLRLVAEVQLIDAFDRQARPFRQLA